VFVFSDPAREQCYEWSLFLDLVTYLQRKIEIFLHCIILKNQNSPHLCQFIQLTPGVDVIYDHNFLRFLPIFGEKMAFFSKTNVMIKFCIIYLCFEKKTPIFSLNFSAKIFLKIIASVPETIWRRYLPSANILTLKTHLYIGTFRQCSIL
jgi:hypothetical protein